MYELFDSKEGVDSTHFGEVLISICEEFSCSLPSARSGIIRVQLRLIQWVTCN